jgi:catechol 2,3-dioxygenase-like lactoylglutathione lyase family enzyme
MTAIPAVSFSHVGIYVRDMETMLGFYTRLLGMRVTDRGELRLPGQPQIVFLSRDPREHHQIALVSGRGEGSSTINQLSFDVASLADLRRLHTALAQEGRGPSFALNHGISWSVYTYDPEGNMLELYVHSPWYVPQPITDPLDLSQSDDEIRRSTEAAYRDRPGFQPMAEWQAAFSRALRAPVE